MRGDPTILIKLFAKDMNLRRAMEGAGYFGKGSMNLAVQDIETHADLFRREILCLFGGDEPDLRLRRILREYERIAFDEGGGEVKISDKLRALEMYRVLSEREEGGKDSASPMLSIFYDYGDGDG